MAFFWESCSVKQLSVKCNMQSKLVSAHLKQLTTNGIVETISTNTKNHLYRLSERFFNMWLMVTQGNPEQKRKARWLTIFLETWYDSEQLKKLAGEHITNLTAHKFSYDKALVLTKAYSQLKYINTDQRDEMLDMTALLNISGLQNSYLELPKKYKTIKTEILKLKDEKNYQKAHEVTDELENEDDGVKFFFKALLFKAEGKNKEAEKYYLLVIDKGHIDALFNLAYLYRREGKNKEAEKYYLLAIDKGHIDALFNLAYLYRREGKNKEAEKYYLLAIDKGDVKALFNLAYLYRREGKNKEAEKYYLLAIDKGDVKALFNLAYLYRHEGKNKEAEKYYLLAIDKGNIWALYNLAMDYCEEGKNKEAEKYYLLAIDKGNVDALNDLAILYTKEGKNKEAEKYYLLAIDKGDVKALHNLAVLYYSTNQNKKTAFDLIRECNTKNKDKDKDPTQMELIIEIWNGIFENTEKRAQEIINDNQAEDVTEFIKDLLIQEQKHLVLHLFEDETHGKILKDRYALLYYATLLLTNADTAENITLRIPPEVMPTVLEIVEEVKTMQAFYAGPENHS